MTFEDWWSKNESRYTNDALHMSEFHMASVVWEASQMEERKTCANICDHEQGTAEDAAYKIRMRDNA